jgi:hypothetical protein
MAERRVDYLSPLTVSVGPDRHSSHSSKLEIPPRELVYLGVATSEAGWAPPKVDVLAYGLGDSSSASDYETESE